MSACIMSSLAIRLLRSILQCSMTRGEVNMKRRTARTAVLVAAAGVCVSVAGGLTVATMAAQHPTADQTPAGAPLVPAVTAQATRQDVPIYADGVGTVQAYQSVLVRARVDGTLMQFPVIEGQEVKQGDLIAVIDPRPFHAALDQANAKKAQDAAQLANAR